MDHVQELDFDQFLAECRRRGLTPPANWLRQLPGERGAYLARDAKGSPMPSVSQAIDQAMRSQPAGLITVGSGESERFAKFPNMHDKPASLVRLPLGDVMPSAPQTAARALLPAGERESLATSIVRRSLAMQAGTRLVVIPNAPGPEVDRHKRPAGYSVITGATFDAGDATTPLVAQELPVATEEIDYSAFTPRGARFEISRRDMKMQPSAERDAIISHAIAHGLANLVDRLVLERLAGETLSPFSLAAAAGAGVRFPELGAVVGTGGAGAQVGEDGQLRVAGVPAELTDQNAGTFVGAWRHAAVAIHDDIRLLVERTSIDGKVAITCWADLEVLVPDASYFWSVAA